MKIKIIFDKEKIDRRYQAGWGISYLLQDNVLFDTGEKGQYIIDNMKMLNIEIEKIKKVVISHNHWDHLGGLWSLLEIKKNILVYACSDFIREFKEKIYSYSFKEVDIFQEIEKDIYTSGCLKTVYRDNMLLEQFLIVKTNKGISVVCGCLHCGLLKTIDKVKEFFPQEKIYSVFGGFHLMDKDNRFIKYVVDQMKKIGIKKVGPSHCTGYEAKTVFKDVYKEDYFDIKIGMEFEI